MRVVAGHLRGRRIDAPPGSDTRPTTDRVREAIFNALGSLGILEDAVVADLFAGSGALGIEALSRGADRCTFVERDRSALKVLGGNLAALGLDDRSRVVAGDALLAAGTDADIVIADPPYTFDEWDRLLSAVTAPFLVAEADHVIEPVEGWTVTRSKRYGRTWVTFLERDIL
ncbi:MAG: 16S rRNA (guanine(966)-N(2))-methyltransferase RsmD [Ilumatobacter coccineus]|uniref:16S rRNA (Guanine(966)-N(2))-methyltransferase RsmD n=1 Tax=Ilumatobacter coccineus TaxID=467094 RepID=A0A2G6KAQ1_9ACTN|nr:MAG: 16S rRNA (guanine(966)-N(2))-methyltransferase RsmD [Ilumatobacter coccineus]